LKNLSVLLQALRIAVDAGVDAHLVLVGEGPLRQRLLAEGLRLAVNDRLTVIGPYPRHELGGIYASADVFAFPSVVDTQAFVLNEAAHEGLALLVSDTANCVVEDGVSAIVVPPEPAPYAAALARLGDRRLRDRLGTAARRRAERVGEAAQSARLAEVIRRAAGGLDGAPARHGSKVVTARIAEPLAISLPSAPAGESAVSEGAPTR
jgi:1,2-diacylglycerol 3-alpha-glucosyltransferase